MLNWWCSLTRKNQVSLFIAVVSVLFGVSYFSVTNHGASIINIGNSFIMVAPVSPSFEDAYSACEFYEGKYRSEFPYIVIDKVINHDSNIRAISYDATWDAKGCKKNGKNYELYGIERTLHRIEIKLKNQEQGDFEYVADGLAVYRSKVVIDSKGRIIKRTIQPDEFKSDIKPTHENEKLGDLPLLEDSRGRYFNSLIINPTKEMPENVLNVNKEYKERIDRYIEIRKGMHRGLNVKGCSVISTISNLTESDHTHQLTIAFLCPTHARVMVRQL
ncbi:hypothetical protein [Nitrosomonas ureae]|uniref:Uncharacterized protein n=1 Tax=Nitrosomonas ureae TaxID=44577 RepID=A0A1H9BN35_9PROT|nr:hypothetical protein [Nitrosomonas ureae]SEP90362.1 hypothetical protein SAMN05421510_100948 [Nitrosomonas ureae]